MTTVPTGPISMSDLSSAFGLGNTISSYYGARWFKNNNSRGYFQSSGTISLSDFAGTRNTSPVSPSYAIYYGSQNVPLPMFNNLTVTVKGGDGGTNGVPGNCNGGGGGGGGGTSYLSGYVSAGGGGGGGGTGATASTSLSINDSNQNSILALYGTQPYGQVGGGGGGGSTGYNTRYEFICTRYDWVTVCTIFGCAPVYSCVQGFTASYCDIPTGGGSGGAGGYIRLDWS